MNAVRFEWGHAVSHKSLSVWHLIAESNQAGIDLDALARQLTHLTKAEIRCSLQALRGSLYARFVGHQSHGVWLVGQRVPSNATPPAWMHRAAAEPQAMQSSPGAAAAPDASGRADAVEHADDDADDGLDPARRHTLAAQTIEAARQVPRTVFEVADKAPAETKPLRGAKDAETPPPATTPVVVPAMQAMQAASAQRVGSAPIDWPDENSMSGWRIGPATAAKVVEAVTPPPAAPAAAPAGAPQPPADRAEATFALYSDGVFLIDLADGADPIALPPTVTRAMFRYLDRLGGGQVLDGMVAG